MLAVALHWATSSVAASGAIATICNVAVNAVLGVPRDVGQVLKSRVVAAHPWRPDLLGEQITMGEAPDVTGVREVLNKPKASKNAEFPWDRFDSEAYLKHNYENVLDDDLGIMEFVRGYFAEKFVKGDRSGCRGIDVGTGTNLYPTLTMLPYCDDITLFEYSQSNVDWLAAQRRDNWPSWKNVWQSFWERLRGPEYARFEGCELQDELTRRTRIVQGSVFDLPGADEPYDIGTMFFVAESISTRMDEFEKAIGHFLDTLGSLAVFAIALMEHSTGYDVAGVPFPSTNITKNEVRTALGSRATDVQVKRFPATSHKLRTGYTGMIIVCGQIEDGNAV